jgi:predicted acetyltransferase
MPFRLRDCLPFAGFGTQGFRFLDPGPLIDGELELVPPSPVWIDALLAICRHPTSIERAPNVAETTRQNILDFLKACPDGRQAGKPSGELSPAYHFWMHVKNDPQFPIAGGINLRVGTQFELIMFHGQIGYHVYPPMRGRHYAERASRLLLPLAKLHGIDPLWITCNPDNFASRRTCERLGGKLVEIVPVPPANPLFRRGETQKCRYRFDLA